MSRFFLAAFGALVGAAVFWVVFGSIAAVIGSRMPGGAREGAGAMGGFFFVGALFGIVGFALAGWIVWRLLEIPARTGSVALGVTGVLAALIVGVWIAMRPVVVLPDDFNGRRAEWRVEVSAPAPVLDAVAPSDRLTLEFRSADGTAEAPALRTQARRENGRTVIPAVFVTRTRPRSELLAVMKNDSQLVCSTLIVDGEPGATTEWSQWQDLEDGWQARWRLVVAAAASR